MTSLDFNWNENCTPVMRNSFYAKGEWNLEIWENILHWCVSFSKMKKNRLLGLSPASFNPWRTCRGDSWEKAVSRGATNTSSALTTCVTYVRSVHVQIQTVLLSLNLRMYVQIVFLHAHWTVLGRVQRFAPRLHGPRRLWTNVVRSSSL
jgi:hypothetical protein